MSFSENYSTTTTAGFDDGWMHIRFLLCHFFHNEQETVESLTGLMSRTNIDELSNRVIVQRTSSRAAQELSKERINRFVADVPSTFTSSSTYDTSRQAQHRVDASINEMNRKMAAFDKAFDEASRNKWSIRNIMIDVNVRWT